ncbi:MAG: ABC transporter permease [Bacteroidota bacterium]
MDRYLSNFYTAIEAVLTNKVRAFLTALGIVFGVAAVIAMLAIGTGAKKELLEQMKLVGTNNIVIESLIPDENGEEESTTSGSKSNKRPYSPGLSLNDANNIQKTLSNVELVSPEIVTPSPLVRKGKLKRAKCVGVTNAFFTINNFGLEKGKLFQEAHLVQGSPVCIIGKSIQAQFFSGENPIGKQIKAGNTWLTVIGILDKRIASKENLDALGIRDYNSDVYIPVKTMLLRFKDRSLLNAQQLGGFGGGGFIVISGDEDLPREDLNYHQLDKLVIRVKDAAYLQPTADVIGRMLKRRHWDVLDYEVSVPELLLKQQQRTQDIFNMVLGAIAGISLLVGGIGIMNIMLASVLERIKEIGLRRSLGATEGDIVNQFLFESVFISLIGGLAGVALGVLLAKMAAGVADIPTVVTFWSILLSFGVAACIGLGFGIVPARRAARLDPIIALRNE